MSDDIVARQALLIISTQPDLDADVLDLRKDFFSPCTNCCITDVLRIEAKDVPALIQALWTVFPNLCLLNAPTNPMDWLNGTPGVTEPTGIGNACGSTGTSGVCGVPNEPPSKVKFREFL